IKQFECPCIGHKVRFPNVAGELKALVVPGVERSLAVEIALAGIKAIREDEVVAKDEVQVVEQVDHCRCTGHRQITRRLAAAAIKELMPSIQRRREERTRLPFEGLLLVSAIPDRCSALAAEDIDSFFEELALGFQAFPRRNFADVAIVNLAGAFHLK